MDKVIVTVLLIIGGIVAAFAIINGVYPALERSSNAINSATNQVNDQIKSQIEIISVSSEGPLVQIWVKNVGTSIVSSIENSDIFLSTENDIERLPFGNASSPLPYWDYELKGSGTGWGQTVTNEISLHLASPLAPGSYKVKVVIPNGISDETTFGE